MTNVQSPRPSPPPAPRRRHEHVFAWMLLAAVCLGLGGIGGYWVAARLHAHASAGAASDAQPGGGDEAEQLYTCGMHPNVIQKGPGDCPICHMKLTPLRAGGADDGAMGGPQERKVLYWRSPMHADFVADQPGKDPMGMKLVPVYADESESAVGKKITIDPVVVQNMGIRTTDVRRGPLARTIRTVGRVDYNEQTVYFVNTKFEGWIEKLHVNQTGVQVERGDPLFDVYSPKLYAAQEEYLAALQGVRRLREGTMPEVQEQSRRLVDAARTQLKYFDVSDAQVEQLGHTGDIQKALTIHSPASGIVTEKMALEGMYMTPGMQLYTIADLAKVWVYVDVYEYQLPWVHVGQEARMTLPYVPDREFTGQVTYVYPYLEKQTRVIRVRLEFDNPDLELKPGMYANVMLRTELDRDALLIPREAYIDSGVRKVAFVDLGQGKFQPRDIQVGVEAEGGMVEVRYGLDEGERVVTSGQFLLDGESKLKEAIAKMLAGQQAAPVDAEHEISGEPETMEKPMPPGRVH